MEMEKKRVEQYESAYREKVESWEVEKKSLLKKHAQDEETISNEIEQEIQFEIEIYNNLMKDKTVLLSKHKQIIKMIEEDAEMEMIEETKAFELAVMKERKAALRLREEKDISKKKYDALIKDFDEHKETVVSLKENKSELSTTINSMRKLKSKEKQELEKLEKGIVELDRQINVATEETNRMER